MSPDETIPQPLPTRGLRANREWGDSRAKYAVVGSTGQRNILDLGCSERTHNVTNWSPWIVARTQG